MTPTNHARREPSRSPHLPPCQPEEQLIWEMLMTPLDASEAADFAAFFEDYPRRTAAQAPLANAGIPSRQ